MENYPYLCTATTTTTPKSRKGKASMKKLFSSMRTFTVGKYEVCVFPGGCMYHVGKDGKVNGCISLDLLMSEKPEDEERSRSFFEDYWNEAYGRYADLEEKIALWMYATDFYGLQGVILYNIGIRKVGQTHGVMMDKSKEIDGKYVSIKEWVNMGSLIDFRNKLSDEDNEFLDRVEAEVERIDRGYDCNFRCKGGKVHHINGYNHFCFSLDGDKVHPLTVGGSLRAYAFDFPREKFIDELKNICIASPYNSADNDSTNETTTQSPNKTTKNMTTKERVINDFRELNEDAEKRWEDEKILQLCNYKEDGDVTRLTVGIGKFDTTYHDLVVDEEGISIEEQSEKNPLIEDVITYFLNPIFFGR